MCLNLNEKKHVHKNPCCFRVFSDFEADNENDNSYKGDKTTSIYKQNPVCNGYYIVCELSDVLQTDYFESPLGYDKVDWFVYEVIKLFQKWASLLKTLKKVLKWLRMMKNIIEKITFVGFVKRNNYGQS